MKTAQLPRTDLRMSRFVFGTASLFNVGAAKARDALLRAAVDAGFTHFDTAPLYGFGHAESDLAPVLRDHPDLTLTTKVGIYAPGGEDQTASVVWLRKAAGRLLGRLSRAQVDFSLARARASLEASLRRTGREAIDLYLLHEPTHALTRTDEWQQWLLDCVRLGKVRHFGVALHTDELAPFLSASPSLCSVVQVLDTLDGPAVAVLQGHGRTPQITYGYVSAALRADPAADVADVLTRALRRNRDGAVVVSTGRIARLAQYARIAQETTLDP